MDLELSHFLPASLFRTLFFLTFSNCFLYRVSPCQSVQYIPTYFVTCVSMYGLSDKIHPVSKLDIDEMFMLF